MSTLQSKRARVAPALAPGVLLSVVVLYAAALAVDMAGSCTHAKVTSGELDWVLSPAS